MIHFHLDRCKLENENTSVQFYLPESVLNISYPFEEKSNEYSKCEYFVGNETKKCNEYIWDDSKFKSSAVKSYGLICENSIWRASADSFLMAGVFIGSFFFGQLSDKIGRKPVFIASLIFQLIFGLLTALSPNFITYTICRMVMY